MRQELKYTLPPIVLLAFVLSITSEYCKLRPIANLTSYVRNESPFNPYCYVKSFSPEPPEMQTTTSTSVSSSAVVGTATVSTTTTL